MNRSIMWQRLDAPGLEHFLLIEGNEEIVADGIVLAQEEEQPFRIHYVIHCDLRWAVREARIELMPTPGKIQRGGKALKLKADGAGHWSSDGTPALSYNGCLDIDLAATPFTNTLPIRRLALKPGQSAEISVVYIAFPTLEVKPAQQRYTCLELAPEGGRYRYEGLNTGFTREITVDADGLVIDYPDIWRRV